jgi:hypothetical protein
MNSEISENNIIADNESTGYDVAVCYRAYPGMNEMAPVLKESKLKFTELCLKTFKDSLGDLKVKMFVVLDDCPEFDQLFYKYFDKKDIVMKKVVERSNPATFAMQLEILSAQNDAEIVYIAEDDYFFLPNSFGKMVQFMKDHPDVHFINPYDHLDYYELEFHSGKYEIRSHAGQHWRTVSSTTGSFLTTKTVLIETTPLFMRFPQVGMGDASWWLCLTKFDMFKFKKILKFRFKFKNYYDIISRSWKRGFRFLLFGKKYKLWAPIPSLATHMMKNHLPPNIDWYSLFNNEIKKLKLDS